MIPPMGQASLGIEIVCNNSKVREIAESLKDEDTFICTQTERDFISKIGVGCSAPVACNAVIDGDNIVFRTMIGFANGENIMSEKIIVNRFESSKIGVEMADKMIANGAINLLKQAEKMAFKDEMPQRL
jgi:hydroxymethylbilane synthase